VDVHNGGMLPRCNDRWMDHRVGGRRVGGLGMKDNYYFKNNLDRLLVVAEKRVEELKIMKEIRGIDEKMKVLSQMHPPKQLPLEVT
jgi:hypothetical protein